MPLSTSLKVFTHMPSSHRYFEVEGMDPGVCVCVCACVCVYVCVRMCVGSMCIFLVCVGGGMQNFFDALFMLTLSRL